jgi:PAS domain S-box-containing protein
MRTDRETRIKALKVGAEAFLTKPPDETELIAQLRAMTKIRAACRLQRQEKERLAALVLERTRELQRELEERKRVEEALQKTAGHLHALVQTIPDLIWLKDKNGVYLSCNQQFERFYGAKETDIIGKTDYNFVDRKLADFFVAHDRKAMAAEMSTSNEEWITYADNGNRVLLETIKTPMFDDKGELIGVLGIGRDITERKRAEEDRRLFTEELARSNSDLQQFAYVASHDLQEPLRMVSSYLQLIERRYKDKLDDDTNTFIHYAVDGANRMQALIIGLLEFSRIKTHGQIFAPVEVTAVLQAVCRNLDALIVESGAVVRYGEMPVIQADEAQITRLLQNLLQNALKFRREGIPPVIDIRAETTETGQVFSVHDNGIGIEGQYFERIFTIFQRLHTQEQYPGTGIGLSICKRIVERHGGNIWLESTADVGTTFYFSIPGDLQ